MSLRACRRTGFLQPSSNEILLIYARRFSCRVEIHLASLLMSRDHRRVEVWLPNGSSLHRCRSSPPTVVPLHHARKFGMRPTSHFFASLTVLFTDSVSNEWSIREPTRPGSKLNMCTLAALPIRRSSGAIATRCVSFIPAPFHTL